MTYSGTSLLRSPTGLGKSDLNGEVTLLQGVICTVEYNLGLSHGDCNGEVFLQVRCVYESAVTQVSLTSSFLDNE